MKIAINCRSFLGSQPTGIGRYARSLVQGLAALPSAHQYMLYCPKGLFDRKRRVPVAPASNFSVRQDPFKLGVDFACGRPDVYHAPSPEVLKTKARRVVVTVNDMVHKIFPGSHTPETIVLSDMAMASVAARADVLVCISEATRQDVERFYPGTKGRTRVIYNGIDPAVFYPLNETDLAAGRVHLSTALGIEDEFLLFAGTLEPRKNLANTLKAFAHLKRTGRFNGKLVVAGMKGWLDGAASGLVGDLGIARDVVFLGYLTDTELRYLYNLCAVFVFPSFYEGFGFPVVEAMACGAVVVTSNVSSCGEVAGDGALTVDPASHLAIAEAIGQGVEDTVLRRQLKEKALVRAAGFFLKRTVTETALLHETFG